MISFKVYRKHLKQSYTIGKLFYKIDNGDWVYFCDTLEDVVRPSGEKVYGETAIPYGNYEFILTQSVHFQCMLPLLLDVPNFSGVRIHWGNSNLDTKGCILVGENKQKGRVINSRATFDKFMNLLKSNKQQKYNLIICQ